MQTLIWKWHFGLNVADTKSTPSYPSELHFLVFQDRSKKGHYYFSTDIVIVGPTMTWKYREMQVRGDKRAFGIRPNCWTKCGGQTCALSPNIDCLIAPQKITGNEEIGIRLKVQNIFLHFNDVTTCLLLYFPILTHFLIVHH